MRPVAAIRGKGERLKSVKVSMLRRRMMLRSKRAAKNFIPEIKVELGVLLWVCPVC
jgi:hypothetical protein